MSIKFQLPVPEVNYPFRIRHGQKIMLSGSCFTEHIGQYLRESGFEINSNPHGILFNPLSVTANLQDCLNHRQYDGQELFKEDGVWHHWSFHSRFSDVDPEQALRRMNASVTAAHRFLKEADWLFVTLGSAFQYLLEDKGAAHPVANCHRVPASRFVRQLCSIEEMSEAFDTLISALTRFNPRLKLILTISPVRHAREGIVENNRSKARLIEVVGRVMEKHPGVFYFPAYELVIDVLRDYRFFDIDLVHPNYAATAFVWQYFESCFFSPETKNLGREVEAVHRGLRHKPRFPGSDADQRFRQTMYEKVKQLQTRHPELDLQGASAYFAAQPETGTDV